MHEHVVGPLEPRLDPADRPDGLGRRHPREQRDESEPGRGHGRPEQPRQQHPGTGGRHPDPVEPTAARGLLLRDHDEPLRFPARRRPRRRRRSWTGSRAPPAPSARPAPAPTAACSRGADSGGRSRSVHGDAPAPATAPRGSSPGSVTAVRYGHDPGAASRRTAAAAAAEPARGGARPPHDRGRLAQLRHKVDEAVHAGSARAVEKRHAEGPDDRARAGGGTARPRLVRRARRVRPPPRARFRDRGQAAVRRRGRHGPRHGGRPARCACSARTSPSSAAASARCSARRSARSWTSR